MYFLERKDAEKMLFEFLKRTLIKESDIEELMSMATKHDSGPPMKGIMYKYDKMERNELTAQNLDDLSTLMHFYGP
ncbi:TPA: hypothetical protein ACPY41_004339 [Enterobacter hormaechei subsp. hoffmannii]|jgi:hypothetical protein